MTKKKLTEKDILAWKGPESDYMNEQHLAFFRELLTQQQDELINKAGETTGRMQSHETAADPADRASQEEEYALDLRARDRERKLLAKIQASLRHRGRAGRGRRSVRDGIRRIQRAATRRTAGAQPENWRGGNHCRASRG